MRAACDELAQVGGAHAVLLLAEGVVEVELVDAQLVRHRHIAVVRHALGNPMVAADRFEPPDLARVTERDTVGFVCAVFLEQRAEALHAFARRLDVRQHDGHEILFAQAAGHGRLIAVLAFRALRRHIFDERIGAEHALVRGDRLGRAHRDVRFVDAGLAPFADVQVRVRHRRVLQWIVRQRHRQMALHGRVGARLVGRLDHDEALRVELPEAGILIARDDRRSVVAGVPANQNRCAAH